MFSSPFSIWRVILGGIAFAGVLGVLYLVVYHRGSQAEVRKELVQQHKGDVLVAHAQAALGAQVVTIYKTALPGKVKVIHDIEARAVSRLAADGDSPPVGADSGADRDWAADIDGLREQAARDAPSWATPGVAPGGPPSVLPDPATRAPD